MRSLKPALIVAALAMTLLASGIAMADRSSGGGSYKGRAHYGGKYYGRGHYSNYYRGSLGVVIGGPFWSPS